ncbi:hypothetical protein ABZU53_18090 [Micromonospora sp. NPDC005194]|uniref:hypothetical protein n=1 Tax=Micromonospora sp. NPDC005194 TaxID=3156870 RepID=UPI0033A301A8
MKVLTVSTGIDFPHAAQALQIRRRRRRLDQPKRFTTETVYAHHRPARAPSETGATGRMDPRPLVDENKDHWLRDVTYDDDRCQIRPGTGPEVMAALRNAAIGAPCAPPE